MGWDRGGTCQVDTARSRRLQVRSPVAREPRDRFRSQRRATVTFARPSRKSGGFKGAAFYGRANANFERRSGIELTNSHLDLPDTAPIPQSGCLMFQWGPIYSCLI